MNSRHLIELVLGILVGAVFIVLNYVVLRKLVSGLLNSGSRLQLLVLGLTKIIGLSAMVCMFLWLGTTYTWGLCIATTIFIAILLGSSLRGDRAGMLPVDD